MSVSTVAGTATANARTFMLPDLGEGLTEAEVIEWHVAPGDEVHVDQIVVTVETAKASVDLPCPYAGPVLTLHSEPGAVLEVGRPLLTIGAQQMSATRRRPEESGSGNVLVGYGTSEARRSGRRRVTPGRPPAARTAGSAAAGTVPPKPPATSRSSHGSRPATATSDSSHGSANRRAQGHLARGAKTGQGQQDQPCGAGPDRSRPTSSAGPTSRPHVAASGRRAAFARGDPAQVRSARTGLATYGSRCVACARRSRTR